MNIYIVNNIQHYDCYKRSETDTKIIDVYKNKLDAMNVAVNYNLSKLGDDDAEYLENDLYLNLEDEIDDDTVTYDCSDDDFFWKKYNKDISKLNINEDVLEDINNILTEYLKNKEDGEYSMSGSYNIYDVKMMILK